MRQNMLRKPAMSARPARLFLYVLITTGLIACDRKSTSEKNIQKPLQGTLIAMIGPAGDNPRWPAIRGGAERYAADIPSLHLQCATPDAPTTEALRSTLLDVLERRPRAVCLATDRPEIVRPVLTEAAQRNVLVVTFGPPLEDSRIYGHVSVDWVNGAELLAQDLKRLAAGGQSYLLLHAAGRDPLATECYNRFRLATRHTSGMTLLREQNVHDHRLAPAALAEELLDQFSHASLLVTLNTDIWIPDRPSWHRELRALNSDFRFVTLSTTPSLWRRLGTPLSPGLAAALVGPIDGDVGYAAIDMAAQALRNARGNRTRRLIPCEIVTAGSLRDFARRYADAAGGIQIDTLLPTGVADEQDDEHDGR